MIGSAGSDEKCKWLKEELGFDHVFNYKTRDLHESLTEFAPDGIDMFMDLVWHIVFETANSVLSKPFRGIKSPIITQIIAHFKSPIITHPQI